MEIPQNPRKNKQFGANLALFFCPFTEQISPNV